jgi:plasmid maintenance system antidote protein VapI
MLNDEEVKLIREKMEIEHIFGATLARKFGVTRQAINYILNQNQRYKSKNLAQKLREWVNGDII